jgi:putative membrane protein
MMSTATNNELANDRTFLAWLRTAIACMGLGFVVAKIALIIRSDGQPVPDHALYTGIGVLLVLSGGALVVTGNCQHRKVHSGLTVDGPPARGQWPQLVTALAVIASLALSVLIVVSS